MDDMRSAMDHEMDEWVSDEEVMLPYSIWISLWL